jgi:hypothetical protein
MSDFKCTGKAGAVQETMREKKDAGNDFQSKIKIKYETGLWVTS